MLDVSAIALPQNLETSVQLYEVDFYAWTQQQSVLIRDGRWAEVDRVNLWEEIESLGRQQRQELRSRLGVLIGHLLKWQYQPQRRSQSWITTLRLQRIEIVDLLNDNPSLKPYLEEAIDRAYLRGLTIAVDETNLSTDRFPIVCDYTLTEMLNDDFYPGESSGLL